MEKRFKRCYSKSIQSGVSLIELMVVVAIISIIALIAAPNLSPAMKAWDIRSAASEIQLDISQAKSEATRLNSTVAMCGGSVDDGCIGKWSEGRLIFLDVDGNGTYTASDTLIKQSAPSKNTFGNEGSGSLAKGLIRFRSSGMPIGGEGTIIVCDNRVGAYGTAINVANVGNPKIKKDQMCGG